MNFLQKLAISLAVFSFPLTLSAVKFPEATDEEALKAAGFAVVCVLGTGSNMGALQASLNASLVRLAGKVQKIDVSAPSISVGQDSIRLCVTVKKAS